MLPLATMVSTLSNKTWCAWSFLKIAFSKSAAVSSHVLVEQAAFTTSLEEIDPAPTAPWASAASARAVAVGGIFPALTLPSAKLKVFAI